MKFNIHISQKQALELNISNINQAVIFDMLTGVATWAKTEIVAGEVYYWVARQVIAKELPILNLKPDTIYRHLKSLADIGLIEHIKVGKKDCIRITDKGRRYYVGNESELTDKLGNESEKDSDLNPTYHYTNNNQSLNYKELPPEINQIAFHEMLQHRKDLKKKETDLTIVKLTNILKKYSNEDQQYLIDYSIAGGYPSLYENQLERRNDTRSKQAISGQLTGAAKQSADFHDDLKKFASRVDGEAIQQDADFLHPQMDKFISN